jgi:hypothetical protein
VLALLALLRRRAGHRRIKQKCHQNRGRA